MIHYVFPNPDTATAAADAIAQNVRDWLAKNVPDALSSDGQKLRGRIASSGAFVDVYTLRWATPELTASGLYVFEKPTQQKTSPIPVGVFLSGIVADEAEYDPTWFPVSFD
jgi:hypothetical protein